MKIRHLYLKVRQNKNPSKQLYNLNDLFVTNKIYDWRCINLVQETLQGDELGGSQSRICHILYVTYYMSRFGQGQSV